MFMTEPTTLGRNEPCHCGSGKKFKRCHGADAAPKLNAPKIDWSTGVDGNPVGPMNPMAAGMNPAALQSMMGQFDPGMLSQFSETLAKLPRGKMHQLQALMQAAMAGKDISAEAEEFEKGLPPDVQQMLMGFKNLPAMMGGMQGGAGGMPAMEAAPAAEMPQTVDDARAIIERAVADGKLSRAEADKLLKPTT